MNETSTPPDDGAEAYLTLPTPKRLLASERRFVAAWRSLPVTARRSTSPL